jgi:Spy/CpxP family protein refolding chaperone
MNKAARFTLTASAVALALCTLPVSAADQTSKAPSDQQTQSQPAPRPYGRGGWGGGYGMGPGMMGGGYGMGPGMMGGGYGMGPGMMGGGYGMGPGMMGWGGPLGTLDLTEKQQEQINRIRDETRKAHWSLMGAMMDEQAKLRDLYSAPKRDQAAIDRAYKNLGQMQQQMYDSSVNAQKRIEAVLTKEQQEKLKSFWRKSGPEY